VRVRAGQFRAFVPIASDDVSFPLVQVDDIADDAVVYDLTEVDAKWFVPAIKSLRAYIGTDATRSWSMHACIRNGKMYASNNVVAVEASFPAIATDGALLPDKLLDELIRVGKPPRRIVLTKTDIYFFFSATWWIRSLLGNVAWPIDTVVKMFEPTTWATYYPSAITPELRQAIEQLRPFLADKSSPLYFVGDHVSTVYNSTDEGASFEGFPTTFACVNAAQIRMVFEHATHIGLSQYPSPVPFRGDILRGVMAVYKDAHAKDLEQRKASQFAEEVMHATLTAPRKGRKGSK
jgi:hypothetical protein